MPIKPERSRSISTLISTCEIFKESQIEFSLNLDLSSIYHFDNDQKVKLESILNFSHELAYSHLSTKVDIDVKNQDISVKISNIEKSEIPFFNSIYHQSDIDGTSEEKAFSQWQNIESKLSEKAVRIEVVGLKDGLELNFTKIKRSEAHAQRQGSAQI